MSGELEMSKKERLKQRIYVNAKWYIAVYAPHADKINPIK